MDENARFKNRHARVETRVLKTLACRNGFWTSFQAMVDSVSVRFQNARVEKMPLNIRIQWNAGTVCVSECVLKRWGLRVGPSKVIHDLQGSQQGQCKSAWCTILTEMMADEFSSLRPEIKNYKAEADADLIPIPGQLELHGRCRCGVLLSPCFGALFVADLIAGMEELELHYRRRGRYNFQKIK